MSIFDSSFYSSSPTLLFKIYRQGVYYYYSNSKKAIEYDSNTYEPENINVKDSLQINDSQLDSNLTVQIATSSQLIEDLKLSYDNYPFNIEIYRIQNRDAGTAEQMWKSNISSFTITDYKMSSLMCEGFLSESYTNALTRIFATGCRHILYDNSKFGCKVNKLNHETSDTILAIITNRKIRFSMSTERNPDYFIGGIIDFGDNIIRDITNTTRMDDGGTHYYTLTLIKPIPNTIEVGDAIKLYPGCKHNSDDCINKFNNIDNFGGYEYIPRNNPHTGVGTRYYNGE